MKNNGISLIVLVITIIIIIIIAGVIILSLSGDNIIIKAKEAAFKSDIKNIEEEIQVYISSNLKNDGTYVYPEKSDIESANKYNQSILNLMNDKIIYKTSDANEKAWAEASGVIVDYTSGLISNYKLDGDSLDSVGVNNGIIYGNIINTTDRHEKSDKAYNFDGVNDYISVPYTSELAPTSQVTCSAWAYKSDWSIISGNTRILSKTESGGWHISLDDAGVGNGYAAFIIFRAGSGYIYTKYLYTGLSTGWHHFAGTYDGRYTKLYIDGVLRNTIDSSTNSGISYSCNNNLIIGAEASQGTLTDGSYFSGKIDDVRIYNRALTGDEIQKLYSIYWED